MIVVTCSNPPENPPEKNVNRTLVAPRRQRHAPSSVSQRCSCSSTARRRRRACRALKGLWPVAEGKFTPSLDGETMKPAETLFFSGTFCFFVWEIYQPTAWFDLQTRGFYRDNNNILSSFFQQIVRVCVLTIFSKQKILVGSYQQHWIQPNWEGLCTPSRCIDTWARDWSNLKQPPPE